MSVVYSKLFSLKREWQIYSIFVWKNNICLLKFLNKFLITSKINRTGISNFSSPFYLFVPNNLSRSLLKGGQIFAKHCFVFKLRIIVYFLPSRSHFCHVYTYNQPSSIIPLCKNRKRERNDVSDDRRKRMGIKVGNETPCLKNTTN